MPAEFLGHRRYRCGNDMVSTWAGSLAGEDGIGIVAGTGSIGYGERAGRSARAGGWGEQFSDEGSAYWIAIRGLNAFSRMSDGRMPHGPLHRILAREFRLTDDLELCAFLSRRRRADPRSNRVILPAGRAAVDEGDEQALAIFEAAGRELAAIAGSIRTALGYVAGEQVPLSYSGGVFETGERILAPLRRSPCRHIPRISTCASRCCRRVPVQRSMQRGSAAGHSTPTRSPDFAVILDPTPIDRALCSGKRRTSNHNHGAQSAAIHVAGQQVVDFAIAIDITELDRVVAERLTTLDARHRAQ